MGLDMYLMKQTYVQNWSYMKPEELHEVSVRKNGKPHPDIKPERVAYIIEQVAYWRKANAIHSWFVENVQGGKDNCEEYVVSRKQLAELVRCCKEVINSTEMVQGQVDVGMRIGPEGIERLTAPGEVVASAYAAEKLLPTKSGFFFGSTNYDECYIGDLRDTISQVEPLLAVSLFDAGSSHFCYRSSW